MASGLLQHADSLAQEAPDDERYWARATPSTSAAEGMTEGDVAAELKRERLEAFAQKAPHEERYWARATPSTSAAEGMTEGDVAAELKREPLEAIRTLRVFVEFNLVSKVNATKWLFPILLKAQGDLREHIYEALLRWGESDTILIVALAEYYKQGNEERLALAASLLDDIGAPALPALRVLIRSGIPACEIFVPIIARLRDVSVESRLALLAHAASNANADVRYSLLEALRAFAPHEVMPLLRILSRDKDEDTADAARAWLESLEARSQKGISSSTDFEMDIEEPEVSRTPTPETKWLSATAVNLGPAKPRLVLDFIEDEG
jgi:hypothetical protein